MDETTMVLSAAGMAGLMLFPVGRRVAKWIVLAAVGLLFLLLLGEPRLD